MELKPPPSFAEPFDLTAVIRRNADYLASQLEVALTRTAPNEEAREKFTKQWVASLKDTAALIEEVKRLYRVLQHLKEAHLPFAGNPGEPVICTACSLEGARVPWPCEVYRTVTAALPACTP